MGWLGQKGRRGLLFLAIGGIASAIATGCYAAGIFKSAEYDSMDARFQIRGEDAPPDNIVVIGIDEQTLTELRVTFPFRRSLHAQAIDALDQAGAAGIAYDIQFTEPTVPKEDFALYDAVARAGGVVLATTEVDEQGRSAILEATRISPRPAPAPVILPSSRSAGSFARSSWSPTRSRASPSRRLSRRLASR